MFDATALQAITDELNETILHGRIQDVAQLDALSFGFEIYAQHARRYVYVTAHPDDARVHLVAAKLRGSGESPSPLLLSLRKHAENAFVDSITQLPNERVIKIQFDHSIEGISTLVVETIGKYSNIILIDVEGIVIDAIKRVDSSMNRARVVLPRKKYVPPPPQSKMNPATLTSSQLARILDENPDTSVWQTLVKNVAGVSPLFAREVAHRFSSVPSENAREIREILMELTEKPWHPTVAYEENEPAAFAPYPLTHFADVRPFDSISQAIEAFYGATESYAAVKEPLRAQLAEARDKLARKRDALAQEQARAKDIERLRLSGEMILAYAYQIKPRQEMLRAESGSGELEIKLDPSLSAVENSQKYFRDYHRAKDAAARVPALLAAANVEVEYAEQMLNDLEEAENRTEIDAVIQAASAAGLINKTRSIRSAKNRSGLSEPRAFTSRDGFTILVGKNAKQNEDVTFRRANADDLWLHARDVAGAHVVIIRAGRDVPESTIKEAATLAAQHSQARNDSAVDVIVTPRRNVHRVRGGRMGMVTVKTSAIVRIVQ